MSCTIRNLALGGLALAMTACSQSASNNNAPDAPIETWRPFADDSPWNTKIADDPVIDPASDALIADFASKGALYINIAEWSVPVYYIDMSETPKHDVIDLYPGVFGRGFEPPRAIPIPDDATPAQPVKGVGYIAIVDKVRNLEWDMRQAFKREDGRWLTGFGVVTNLRGSGVAKPWHEAEDPKYAASAMASGFPLTAGLIRVGEIKAGRIPHALMFAYPGARTDAFIPPASTAIASGRYIERRDTGMPVGARIQLDPAFDVGGSTLSPEGKVIARALQEYGAYLSEDAGGNVLFAESGPEQLKAWDGVLASDALQAVFTPEAMAKHFRLIDMGDVLPGQPAE
tara:strand:- start:314 stop:1342 length:1029 start_codon:yes stop_codon:yes gene_type:complete